MLGVDGDRALVVVQHGEIEAVDIGDVAQLAARDVADARPLHFDHIGAEPGEKLRAGRPRLHMGEIQDSDAVECLTHYPAPKFRPCVPVITCLRCTHSFCATCPKTFYFLRSTL